MTELAQMSVGTLVFFWTLLALIIFWLLLYAMNPFEWLFVQEIGGGFLSIRRQLSESLAAAINVREAVGIPSREPPSDIAVHLQKTGEMYHVELKNLSSKIPAVMERIRLSLEKDTPLIIFPDECKYVELAHGKLVRLWDSEEKVELQLIGWPGSPPGLAEARKLAEKAAKLLQAKGWFFDTICTLSTTAIPLAYSYMFLVDKDFYVVACDNITGRFLPESFLEERKQRRILLLDAVIQTGAHVERAWKAVEKSKAGHMVVGLVAVLYNDARPPEMETRPFLQELYNEGKAVTLISSSEILANWKESIKNNTPSDGKAADVHSLPGVGVHRLPQSD